jgi:hypothetical protein
MARPVIVLVIGDPGPDVGATVAAALAKYAGGKVPVIKVEDNLGMVTYEDIRRFCLGLIRDRRMAYAQAERAWVQLLRVLPQVASVCLRCKQHGDVCRCMGYPKNGEWRHIYGRGGDWVIVSVAVRALPSDAFDTLHPTTAGNLRAFVASLRK